MMKLNIVNFTELIANRIERKMCGVTVHVCENMKNNGMKLYGISVKSDDCNISPCIYLEDYFQRYRNGELEIEEIVEAVIDCYEQNKLNCDVDISVFTDYTKAAPLLHGRLVNTERNKELLMNVPHRNYLDLSIIYTVDIVNELTGDVGSVRITNEHMDLWGVSEENLYAQLKKNMVSGKTSLIKSLSDVFNEMIGEPTGETFPKSVDEESSMYILTNTRRINGAVEIINDELLERFATFVGTDVIVLPSSVHEWILMPIGEDTNRIELVANTVREINDNVLNRDEILSYHVYKYVRESGKLLIAA